MPVTPLSADALYRRCDPDALGFRTTAELEPVDGLIGQGRAIEALEFGTGLLANGYNIFVLGIPGSGRHNAVMEFLRGKAGDRPAPRDWVYVYNFSEQHRPKALSLPPGRGPELVRQLDALIDTLKTAMPAVFESEDYQDRRTAIEDEFKNAQEMALKTLAEKAQADGLGLGRTEYGFAVFPVEDGQPVKPEDFQAWPKEKREEAQERIRVIQTELQDIMQSIPRLDKDRREKVHALNRQLAAVAVDRAMEELFETFGPLSEVKGHLETIREELANNAVLFVRAAQQAEPGAEHGAGGGMMGQAEPLDVIFNRFKANVVVSHDSPGAPVEFLDHPGLGNLLGRIEYIPHMGAMLTDFTLIKAGSLHKANGGYLVVDAERLLMMPGSWQALKRCLRSQTIAIEMPTTGMTTATTVTLEPEPVPLDVKVILIGQRDTFYLLQQADLDFNELFKVAADFDEVIPWTGETCLQFCRLLGSIAVKAADCALTAAACAEVIERAARLTEDRERLTLRVAVLADLIREASYWAQKDGANPIQAEHIRKAVAEQIRRLDRIRERMHEQILRETILIDTTGKAVGQINGLSVLQIGAFAFGKPTRISARTRVGSGEVADIEREVYLGGSLHSKGVLILSGFLSSRYARNAPISMSASLVFEQSYGGVDGDSASSTELYALLSSLADVPIRQELAVTGSVSQNGDVQAIGGVNEKIEGFFDICKARGLTGHQGVLIPQANVKHLMLRDDVVEACKAGQFAVYPVSHVDEGIELLTGVSAGVRDDSGQFPDGSINRLVEDKLSAFAEMRRRFIAGAHAAI
ncbi:MAG: AAA family ATPase [Hyphomicrobiales bacterium]|nr:AAA family ATPase [Hyphomicrobiales bacterium]